MKKKHLKLFFLSSAIETPRLLLRKMSRSDIFDVYEYAKNPNVSKYLLWSPHPSPEYTEKYLLLIEKMYQKCKFYDFAVVIKETGKMIGTCGFTHIYPERNSAEIGYVLNESYWGMGYAREAVERLIELAREEMRLDTLYAEFMKENESSRRLLTDMGFSEIPEREYELFVKGEFKNISVYVKSLSVGNIQN